MKIMIKSTNPSLEKQIEKEGIIFTQTTQIKNSIGFASPEIRCQMMVPLSQHQNLSKSQKPEFRAKEVKDNLPNSQNITGSMPNLVNSDIQLNLSVYSNSNLSGLPTFVDLDVLRANQQKKPKAKER